MNRNSNHLWVHFVWSTKYRDSLLMDETMKELTAYISKHFKDRPYEIVCSNGYRDHLHVLVKPAENDSISKIAKEIKGATSHWINKEGKINGRFSWQRGFGAYSVSPHEVRKIIRYILNQKIHHEGRDGRR